MRWPDQGLLFEQEGGRRVSHQTGIFRELNSHLIRPGSLGLRSYAGSLISCTLVTVDYVTPGARVRALQFYWRGSTDRQHKRSHGRGEIGRRGILCKRYFANATLQAATPVTYWEFLCLGCLVASWIVLDLVADGLVLFANQKGSLLHPCHCPSRPDSAGSFLASYPNGHRLGTWRGEEGRWYIETVADQSS